MPAPVQFFVMCLSDLNIFWKINFTKIFTKLFCCIVSESWKFKNIAGNRTAITKLFLLIMTNNILWTVTISFPVLPIEEHFPKTVNLNITRYNNNTNNNNKSNSKNIDNKTPHRCAIFSWNDETDVQFCITKNV